MADGILPIGYVCGTAQSAGERASVASDMRRALRMHARGRAVDAELLLAAGLARAPANMLEPTRAVIERAHAFVLADTGRVSEARAIEERIAAALSADVVTLDSNLHVVTGALWVARCEAQRAELAYVSGDIAMAERLNRAAIERLIALVGDSHLEVAIFRDALATLLLRDGRTEQAEALIERARAVYVANRFSYPME